MPYIPGTHDEIKLVSHNGRDVRIDFAQYTMSPAEAQSFAYELNTAVTLARRLPDIHALRHVNLMASCALCRFEAGAQTDRLTNDEEEEDDPSDFNIEGQPEFNGSFR
jgi:hypothetical protein